MRARNLKPGFFQNEELAACGDKARLLFAGLWLIADREGRLEDRPSRIRAQLFPYESPDVNSLLAMLAGHGFIVRYQIDGVRYICIPTFREHQNPHPREAASKIPPHAGAVDPPAKTPSAQSLGLSSAQSLDLLAELESREKALPGRVKALPDPASSLPPLPYHSHSHSAIPGAQSPGVAVAAGETSCAQSHEQLVSMLVERGYPPHAAKEVVARTAGQNFIAEVCRFHSQEQQSGKLRDPPAALRSMLREPEKWLIVRAEDGWRAPGKPSPRLSPEAARIAAELARASLAAGVEVSKREREQRQCTVRELYHQRFGH